MPDRQTNRNARARATSGRTRVANNTYTRQTIYTHTLSLSLLAHIQPVGCTTVPACSELVLSLTRQGQRNKKPHGLTNHFGVVPHTLATSAKTWVLPPRRWCKAVQIGAYRPRIPESSHRPTFWLFNTS